LSDEPDLSPPAGSSPSNGERPADRDTLHSFSAVQRLLNQALTRGTDREVVGAFAEALAVCEDVEVRAYVETIHGRFHLEVMLAGSDPGSAPETVRGDALPELAACSRLSGGDVERLRFRAGEDVVLARVGTAVDIPWLIAFSGSIPAEQESRLVVYVDLLDQALRSAASQAATRASWAILEHLLPSVDRPEPAAEAALAALNETVGGRRAALMVTMTTGMHVLSVGDRSIFSAPRTAVGGNDIVATARILDRYSMTLAVTREAERPFTRRDRHLLDVAAPIFSTWLAGVLQQPAFANDRRVAPRGFDDIVERVVGRAAEEGSAVSVVLFRVNDGGMRGEAVRRWISDIRGQLRPTDLAGLVSESEVVVLLTDTEPERAQPVVDRLRRRLDQSDLFAGLAPLAVGIASSTADRPVAGSIVNAARTAAQQNAS
jgi:hypothetical protein